jgi:predicted Co/Zn/Cd cation transporter (cation efflux family)
MASTPAISVEQKGVRISLIGALTFAVLGLSFAIWSESQAVLLDGAFNLITALISTGIAISFGLVLIFRDGALKPIVPYVDQVVVLVVGLISLPVPIGAIRNGLRELLLFGAGESIQQKTEDIIRRNLPPEEIKDWKVYVLKTGRKYWMSLFISPSADTIDAGFSDRLKESLLPAIEAVYAPCNLDILISQTEDYQR